MRTRGHSQRAVTSAGPLVKSETQRRPMQTPSRCTGRPAARSAGQPPPTRSASAARRSNASNAAPCARSSLSAGSTSMSTTRRPSASSCWQDELPQANPVRVPAVAGIEQQCVRMRDDQRGRTTSGVEARSRALHRLRDRRRHEQQRKRHADGRTARASTASAAAAPRPTTPRRQSTTATASARHNANSPSAAHVRPGQAKS